MATIVVLNGTSSSGKTTLARAFQEIADTTFLNFSIDDILGSLPQSSIDRIVAGEQLPGLPFLELHRAYYACVRELANLGRDLILDNALTNQSQADLLQHAIAGHRTLIVSVFASAEVLEARERTRGDRSLGLAALQRDLIDRCLAYDLRIDTAQRTPDEGARAILDALRASGS